MKSILKCTSNNIFNAVQNKSFVSDRNLLNRAINAYSRLDSRYRTIFNAVFSDSSRFKKFCTVPSSLNGHHNIKHGNLLHTVEVAEHVIDLVSKTPTVDANLVLLAAFLHDAAKAEEYYYCGHNKCWYMTKQGRLIGHKIVNVQWVSVALASVQHQLNQTTVMALLHLLSTVNHVPSWTGIRQPQMQEAFLLSTADRLSSTQDIYKQTSTQQRGYGTFHPHLNTRTYRIAATQLNNQPQLVKSNPNVDSTVVSLSSLSGRKNQSGLRRTANGRIIF